MLSYIFIEMKHNPFAFSQQTKKHQELPINHKNYIMHMHTFYALPVSPPHAVPPQLYTLRILCPQGPTVVYATISLHLSFLALLLVGIL
jgi:hypothetical protein